MEEIRRNGSLVFAVNGQRFELPSVDPSTTLLQFLRNETRFKSPKHGCGEGGCGACVVLLSKYEPKLKQVDDFSVSSCLTLLCSLNGCSVTTSEGLGNTKVGFHSIHERFTGFHASQCGYCTPGMCMSLFSALISANKSNRTEPPQGFSKLTASEAEKAISGNLCRCTGYRPIADACKTFAVDVDIEDLGLNSFWKKEDSVDIKASKLPPYDLKVSTFPQFLKSESVTSCLDSTRYPWHSPVSVDELPILLNSENDVSVKLVVGNTGTGYYKETQRYCRYIDLTYIPELSIIKLDQIEIEVGAAVTLSKLISFLKEGTEINPSSYVKQISQKLAQHMEKIASPFVRNSASVGGNLVMAQKNGFPSDLSTLFLCLGATVCIISSQGREKLTWEELLARPPLDSRSVLLSVSIPFKKDQSFLFEAYRAAPRPLGNALAYVNAAFLADISPSPHGNGILINNIQLAFGAYGAKHASTRARKVEEYLTGKIFNSNVLSEAVKLVKETMIPEDGTSHPDYRSSLAVGFLFEFLFRFTNAGPMMPDGCISEGKPQTLLSSAKQVVESSKEYFPVGEPMKKIGASMQASGEAVYVDDIPSPANCLYGAFIYSTRPLARVKNIHFGSNSLPDGVTAVITFKDIPSKGTNVGSKTLFGPEPLFADDLVRYAGDRIALVVAESQRAADVATGVAVVEYDTENVDSPVLTVEEAVWKSSFFQAPPFLCPKKVGDFSNGMDEADHKILSAEMRLGSQYYFYMETQTALAVPDEDNCIVVYASSQCPEYAGSVIASCLGVPEHNIRVITRRVGGGFGGKAVRAMPVSTACALAAFKLQCPVRIYLDRKTDMIMAGGRHPMKVTYSVGFKSNGKITALHVDILINAGITEDVSPIIPINLVGALKKYNWGALSFDMKVCRTNLTSKSAMRGPGEVQGSYIAEAIMEHVASVLSQEVDFVRKQNIHTVESLKLFYEHSDIGDYTLPRIMDELAASSSFIQRCEMIEQYNRKNIWKKRGISRVPLVYESVQRPTPGKVSILSDGSIVVEVGGIEIGQGLWTKVKQMTAYALSLIESSWAEELVKKVRVVQADTLSLVQGGFTAGSTTSESSCGAVKLCCNLLVERLTPLKKKLQEQNSSVDWTTLIRQAQMQAVNLAANSYYVPESGAVKYLNYGAAVSEVEIIILTGETKILQSDIIYDCGQSLNPAVDMGQIEGAFVQGIGFFMLEEYLSNDDGLVVSDSTWTYKIPTIDTIPKKFNVKVLNSGHHEKRVLSSKASGEPPLLLAASVHCATRAAIRSARKQLKLWGKLEGSDSEFYLDVPATLPVVKTQCGLDYVEKYLKNLLDQKSKANAKLSAAGDATRDPDAPRRMHPEVRVKI